MPARSNAFQRAMYLLRTRLADTHTEVSESAFLEDLLTRAKREVDIVVRRQVAGAEILIGIECTDLKNPADVGWVEKMHGKHLHLPTNLLVLASGSGFTAEALRKAEALNIDTVRFGDVEDRLANKVVGVLGKVYAKASHIELLRVRLTLEADGEHAEETLEVPRELAVYDETGRVIGSSHAFAACLMQSEAVGVRLFQDGMPEDKFVTIGLSEPVIPGTKQSIYLQKLETHRLRRIKTLELHGRLTLSLWEVPLRHATVDGRHVAWGEGRSTDGASTATIVIDESADRPGATVHVEAHKKKTTKKKAAKAKAAKQKT